MWFLKMSSKNNEFSVNYSMPSEKSSLNFEEAGNVPAGLIADNSRIHATPSMSEIACISALSPMSEKYYAQNVRRCSEI